MEDTIQTNNYKVIKQESESLERMYSDFTNSYTKVLEYSQEVGLPKDIEDIVTLDKKVFEAKQRECYVGTSTSSQSKEDVQSRSSRGSRRKVYSQRNTVIEKLQNQKAALVDREQSRREEKILARKLTSDEKERERSAIL